MEGEIHLKKRNLYDADIEVAVRKGQTLYIGDPKYKCLHIIDINGEFDSEKECTSDNYIDFLEKPRAVFLKKDD